MKNEEIIAAATCGSYTSKTCFACDLPTCANCSRIRQYASYGNQRLCRHCLAESTLLVITGRPERN